MSQRSRAHGELVVVVQMGTIRKPVLDPLLKIPAERQVQELSGKIIDSLYLRLGVEAVKRPFYGLECGTAKSTELMDALQSLKVEMSEKYETVKGELTTVKGELTTVNRRYEKQNNELIKVKNELQTISKWVVLRQLLSDWKFSKDGQKFDEDLMCEVKKEYKNVSRFYKTRELYFTAKVSQLINRIKELEEDLKKPLGFFESHRLTQKKKNDASSMMHICGQVAAKFQPAQGGRQWNSDLGRQFLAYCKLGANANESFHADCKVIKDEIRQNASRGDYSHCGVNMGKIVTMFVGELYD